MINEKTQTASRDDVLAVLAAAGLGGCRLDVDGATKALTKGYAVSLVTFGGRGVFVPWNRDGVPGELRSCNSPKANFDDLNLPWESESEPQRAATAEPTKKPATARFRLAILALDYFVHASQTHGWPVPHIDTTGKRQAIGVSAWDRDLSRELAHDLGRLRDQARQARDAKARALGNATSLEKFAKREANKEHAKRLREAAKMARQAAKRHEAEKKKADKAAQKLAVKAKKDFAKQRQKLLRLKARNERRAGAIKKRLSKLGTTRRRWAQIELVSISDINQSIDDSIRELEAQMRGELVQAREKMPVRSVQLSAEERQAQAEKMRAQQCDNARSTAQRLAASQDDDDRRRAAMYRNAASACDHEDEARKQKAQADADRRAKEAAKRQAIDNQIDKVERTLHRLDNRVWPDSRRQEYEKRRDANRTKLAALKTRLAKHDAKAA